MTDTPDLRTALEDARNLLTDEQFGTTAMERPEWFKRAYGVVEKIDAALAQSEGEPEANINAPCICGLTRYECSYPSCGYGRGATPKKQDTPAPTECPMCEGSGLFKSSLSHGTALVQGTCRTCNGTGEKP